MQFAAHTMANVQTLECEEVLELALTAVLLGTVSIVILKQGGAQVNY
jgi:hypothetical protein